MILNYNNRKALEAWINLNRDEVPTHTYYILSRLATRDLCFAVTPSHIASLLKLMGFPPRHSPKAQPPKPKQDSDLDLASLRACHRDIQKRMDYLLLAVKDLATTLNVIYEDLGPLNRPVPLDRVLRAFDGGQLDDTSRNS